jgi:hypothetical protein
MGEGLYADFVELESDMRWEGNSLIRWPEQIRYKGGNSNPWVCGTKVLCLGSKPLLPPLDRILRFGCTWKATLRACGPAPANEIDPFGQVVFE